jgi:hypothetical protein
VKRLLGSYPVLNAHDPETYIANLVALFTGYPLWAGERALGPIKSAAPEWPPAEGKARKILEEQVSAHRFAAEFQRGAREHLHARLEGPKPEPRPTYEELKAKYGPNWGITNPDKKIGGFPHVTLDQVREKYGADKVDSVPDAADDGWRKLKPNFVLP